jgi:hypothetical protein
VFYYGDIKIKISARLPAVHEVMKEFPVLQVAVLAHYLFALRLFKNAFSSSD